MQLRSQISDLRHIGLAVLCCFLASSAATESSDPKKLLAEADRLAWLRAWTRAEPLYRDAQKTFAASGDRRNALYAEVSELRGKLPMLPVPDVSERLASYLDNPLVQRDDRLRLRVLVIKGETDEDLDPALSQRSWAAVLALAEKLGDAGWANRARAELGLVAFLLGDINTAVVNLGQSMKVAEDTGDTSSLVRWLTLFGHGYIELERPEQAIDFYDRALKVASTVPEIGLPVMTYLGKADALVKLGRTAEANLLIDVAMEAAKREGSLGYQAELTLRRALIARDQKKTTEALADMAHAVDYARAAGGNRILAGIALERARTLRAAARAGEAERALDEGIDASRKMGERLLLPRLLAQRADLRLAAGDSAQASELLREADDILEGLLTNASSPWVRGRILGSMGEVLSARISLEGAYGAQEPTRLFDVVERARGRSLLELLYARPLASLRKPAELAAGERRIGALQMRLLRTSGMAQRQRLLEQIFVAEEQLAPESTELFIKSRRAVRRSMTLRSVQRALRADETFVEYALSEPASFALILTSDRARVQRLAGRSTILTSATMVVVAARNGADVVAPARDAASLLLVNMPELQSRRRLIISAEAGLQQVPFELLPYRNAERLLETHVVTYAQSASILATLRSQQSPRGTPPRILAVGSSPRGTNATTSSNSRGIYDLDTTKLPPLPLATEEAKFVGHVFGDDHSVILVDDAATEGAVKSQPLVDFRVIHLAAHGLVSTKMPARSALLLRPEADEDGFLQAREILGLRLGGALVTLSACDTSAGADQGQDGVASLVRPFIAAGAATVVANLWAADDAFASALMREFYRELAAGTDIGDALRRAKLTLIAKFGPAATPKLWSGVLAFGDASRAVVRRDAPAAQ